VCPPFPWPVPSSRRGDPAGRPFPPPRLGSPRHGRAGWWGGRPRPPSSFPPLLQKNKKCQMGIRGNFNSLPPGCARPSGAGLRACQPYPPLCKGGLGGIWILVPKLSLGTPLSAQAPLGHLPVRADPCVRLLSLSCLATIFFSCPICNDPPRGQG